MKLPILFSLLFLPLVAAAQGDNKGNGGSLVQRKFIEAGEESLERARYSPKVLDLLPEPAATLTRMRGLLTIDVVKVRNLPLTDNKGSTAESLGVPGEILLDYSLWYQKIKDAIPLQKDSFHELLRAANIDDDNYRISKHLLSPDAGARRPVATAPAGDWSITPALYQSLADRGFQGMKDIASAAIARVQEHDLILSESRKFLLADRAGALESVQQSRFAFTYDAVKGQNAAEVIAKKVLAHQAGNPSFPLSIDAIEESESVLRRHLRIELLKAGWVTLSAESQDLSDNPYAEFLGDSHTGLLARSHEPSTTEMSLGQVWYCNSFSAVPELEIGDRISGTSGQVMSKSLPWYRLTTMTDGMVKNTGLARIPSVVSLSKYKSLAGSADLQIVDYIRMSPDGSLVGETTVSPSSDLYLLANRASSVNPKRRVIAYHVCPAAKRRSSSETLAAIDVYSDGGPKGFYQYMKNRKVGHCWFKVDQFDVTETRNSSSGSEYEGYGITRHEVTRIQSEMNYTFSQVLVAGRNVTWSPWSDRKVLSSRELRQVWRTSEALFSGGPREIYRGDVRVRELPPSRNTLEDLLKEGMSNVALTDSAVLLELMLNGTCEIDPEDRTDARRFIDGQRNR